MHSGSSELEKETFCSAKEKEFIYCIGEETGTLVLTEDLPVFE
jgi:hypothetical protein